MPDMCHRVMDANKDNVDLLCPNIHIQILQTDLYTFPYRMLREFDTGSQHLPFGNCSNNSHDLFSLPCIARRKLMLITLVTRVSDKSQKKKSNVAGFLGINSQNNRLIS